MASRSGMALGVAAVAALAVMFVPRGDDGTPPAPPRPTSGETALPVAEETPPDLMDQIFTALDDAGIEVSAITPVGEHIVVGVPDNTAAVRRRARAALTPAQRRVVRFEQQDYAVLD